ncbi:MAG: peptidoglycan DD-metalloendopeptidase family protein [Melioribacteraceae bacterium]|nr:peptidoglycan DD-metalloendopeptidase family protein [Melioribacteraceae bacterium]MCF8355509.1 peptidoglycan DD-metalloendopeptidase family protein [Melioribacteraceae bacterium]MCF8394197.1 peptidoglycan DD-metalloendopeptidase family protein [Melioribacteraceae bacterium]MCF8419917.1 peptidoglycan DD-metalloendopeptidase family protein [Melioribacteraceae bacterium]
MVARNIIFITLLFILHSIKISAQETKEIQQKNVELDKLKSEITRLESDLKNKSAKEKESLSALQNIDEQIHLLDKYLLNLQLEINKSNATITRLKNEIIEKENNIDTLRNRYADYVVWLYKQGRNTTLKYLLDAESFNQALIRYKYLGYITERNKDRLNQLKSDIADLNNSKSMIESERNRNLRLVRQKENELAANKKKKNEKENLISKLKKDQDAITEEIADKRKAEIQIKSLIADLIEKERERLTSIREARLKDEPVPDLPVIDYNKFEDFGKLKGKLNWPVRSGSISRKFGENQNSKLKTVTLNYGVDIKTKENEEVFAVSDGIVSNISWIPGYGSVLIITHKNNYRTVYGHLTEFTVSEGDEVRAGTSLGRVNKGLEGNIIHFEIWNERNYQNPEVWLVRR